MSESIVNKSELREAVASTQNKQKSSGAYNAALLFVIIFVGGGLLSLWSALQAPKSFVAGSVVEFERGDTVTSLAKRLKESGYIKSDLLFKFYIRLSGQGNRIPSGGYYFEAPISTPEMAHRFAVGDTNQTKIRLTIPEGSTVKQVAEIINNKIPNISQKSFLEIATKDEGFIFPDTYFFYSTASAEEVYNKMRNTFDRKTKTLFEKYKIDTDTEKREVVIMASLLEEEGISSVDRKMISGILKKRLGIDMALQVDATINYIKGRPGKVYIKDTLIDSPYNTYTNKGLPPGPISSPGLESIEAALNPTETKYLYYLTGDDGVFYYARTFEEHKKNKAKYIK